MTLRPYNAGEIRKRNNQQPFWISVCQKLWRKNRIIIVMYPFSQSPDFKMFSIRKKKESRRFRISLEGPESSLTRTSVVAMIHLTLYHYKTLHGVEKSMNFQASVSENSALLIHGENCTSFLSNRLCSYETFKWSSSRGINVQDRVPRDRDQILVSD